jgi:uracil-DNA glycosylase
MPHPFDPGYGNEPFLTLCADYPEADVYLPDQFRVEWGPIFHRGRLDGSARVLVIGQDPAQHEAVVRRILVGEAGRRVQGLLAKLGITQSYVLVNTFLYSVYGSVKVTQRKDPRLVGYRNRWLDALLVGKQVEAVVALGTAANEAWQLWKATPHGQAVGVAFAAITHPTQPESSSKGDKAKLAAATKKMLSGWNAALQALAPSVKHPDVAAPPSPYGETWAGGDRPPIPEIDFPAGLPVWMREQDGWAARAGATDLAKRRNITVTVPKGIVS